MWLGTHAPQHITATPRAAIGTWGDTLAQKTDTLALATDTLALATDTLAHHKRTQPNPGRRVNPLPGFTLHSSIIMPLAVGYSNEARVPEQNSCPGTRTLLSARPR